MNCNTNIWDPNHSDWHRNIKDCERIWLPYWQAFISGGLIEMFECNTIEEFKQLEYVKFAADTVGITIDDYTEIVKCMYDDEEWKEDLKPYINDLTYYRYALNNSEQVPYPLPLTAYNSEHWFNFISWFKEYKKRPWEWE